MAGGEGFTHGTGEYKGRKYRLEVSVYHKERMNPYDIDGRV